MTKRRLPKSCPRGLPDCKPLALVMANSRDYVCCGANEERYESEDVYRQCFKTTNTDTMHDVDELDLLDQAEVAIKAITTMKRIKEVMDDKQ